MWGQDQVAQRWRSAWRSGAAQVLLLCLVPVPVLVVTSWLHRRGVSSFASARWNVDADWSWLEVWGYVLVASAACLLATLAWQRRRIVYAAWAFALTVLVLDDALQWHERGGEWLDRRLALVDPPGLREQDIGELATWAAMGVGVLLVLWLGHRRSPPRARRDSWWLVGLVVVLMVFAVGVDMVHVGMPAVTSSSRVDSLVTWTEAAGELTAMAGLLAFAVHVARRPRAWEGLPASPYEADAPVDATLRTQHAP